MVLSPGVRLLAGGAVLLGAVMFLLLLEKNPAIGPVGVPAAGTGQSRSAVDGVPQPASDGPGRNGPNRQDPVRAAPNLATAPKLRGRLVGLRRNAPWTAPLLLDLQGRDRAGDFRELDLSLTVAANGVFEADLPAWLDGARRVKVRLRARDPRYLHVEERVSEEDLEEVLEVSVRCAAVVVGRVEDAGGGPVPTVVVSAYPLLGGGPQQASVADATSRPDGTFTLLAPVEGSLLLVGVAMEPAQISGQLLTGQDGAYVALDARRWGHLPGAVHVRAVLGAETAAPSLVLPSPALVTGVVRTEERAPLAGFPLRLRPVGDPHALLTHRAGGIWYAANGAVLPEADVAVTDAEGAFSLMGAAGHESILEAFPAQGFLSIAKFAPHRIVPPGQAELTAKGYLLLVQVRADDRAAADAHVQIEVDRILHRGRTDDEGLLRLLLPAGPARVRATVGEKFTVSNVIVGPAMPHALDLRL